MLWIDDLPKWYGFGVVDTQGTLRNPHCLRIQVKDDAPRGLRIDVFQPPT